jgi:hypothetical protein
MSWWWSLTRNEAEDDDGPTIPKDRMGPYPTKEAAERALLSAKERTEVEDERDRSWRDGDDDEG